MVGGNGSGDGVAAEADHFVPNYVIGMLLLLFTNLGLLFNFAAAAVIVFGGAF